MNTEKIEAKIEEIKAYNLQVCNEIETKIKAALGDHWGVCRFNRGFLDIGVINKNKSTPEKTEFYFGQTLEVRYEEKSYGTDSDSFEANCCAAGAFSTEGGSIIGERAMFYVGVGKFFENAILIEEIKQLLIEHMNRWKVQVQELHELQKQ